MVSDKNLYMLTITKTTRETISCNSLYIHYRQGIQFNKLSYLWKNVKVAGVLESVSQDLDEELLSSS
jgi:hypothetical protein